MCTGEKFGSDGTPIVLALAFHRSPPAITNMTAQAVAIKPLHMGSSFMAVTEGETNRRKQTFYRQTFCWPPISITSNNQRIAADSLLQPIQYPKMGYA